MLPISSYFYIAGTKHRLNLKEKIFTLAYSSGNTIHNGKGGTVAGTQNVELAHMLNQPVEVLGQKWNHAITLKPLIESHFF